MTKRMPCELIEVNGEYQFAFEPQRTPDGNLPRGVPSCVENVCLVVSNADDSEQARRESEAFLRYVRNDPGPLLATKRGGDAADDG